MTLPTFTPPVLPSRGTKRQPEIKILSAEFGDGYTQDTADGINNIRGVWSLTWEVLTPTQADSIESFLIGLGGYGRFWWTPSNTTTPIKFTCKDWTRTDDAMHQMTATFRQAFDLGT